MRGRLERPAGLANSKLALRYALIAKALTSAHGSKDASASDLQLIASKLPAPLVNEPGQQSAAKRG